MKVKYLIYGSALVYRNNTDFSYEGGGVFDTGGGEARRGVIRLFATVGCIGVHFRIGNAHRYSINSALF